MAKPNVTCRVSGCETLALVKKVALCRIHYRRMRDHGCTDHPQPERRINPPLPKVCAYCSADFMGRIDVHCCSRSCASRLKAQRRGMTNRFLDVTCRLCGLTTNRCVQKDRDAGAFCSQPCCMAYRKAKRLTKESVQAECAALRRIGANVKRWIAKSALKPKRIARCTQCDTQWEASRGEHTKTLCESCRSVAIKATRKVYQKAFRKTPAGRSRHKAEKLKRKTRQRMNPAQPAQNIDPIKVFERDKWRCHICGRKTPKKLRGTYDPRAPELDHVVSLADSGSHTWSNVACACRECNSRKSSRSFGQIQMPWAA